MMMKRRAVMRTVGALVVAIPLSTLAQGSLEDYRRAAGLREKYQALALNIPGRITWIGKTHLCWYRKSVRGGNEFVLLDADAQTKRPAFDHEKVASALSAASGETYAPLALPFQSVSFVDSLTAIEFDAAGSRWKCTLAEYRCSKLGPEARRGRAASPPQGVVQDSPRVSPDGKWEAFIRNNNVWLRAKDSSRSESSLSFDGSEGTCYSSASLVWAPDSRKLAAYRIRSGYHRKIQYVESSPSDQLQPKYSSIEYAKPGDVLDTEQPVLFLVETKRQLSIDNALFPNPYEMSEIVWRKDSRAFTFEYNQRGHQVYRVIEVDGMTGHARPLVSEEPKTFFCYSGKRYRHDLQDGKEIIWMSERDGWNHLYLYDGATGRVKNQITRGNWVVRGVERVDEEKRQIWFRAGGMDVGKDPYFVHYYRINLDGSGLVPLTDADANHSVALSADLKFYVDTWSRVDLPPVCQLHRAADRAKLMEVERADLRDLLDAGWKPPEVLVSRGRDGTTDIWGILFRPTGFDPSRKYPVVEYIYAGPQDSFVPKSFSPYNPMRSLAEMGFIVVQIDGMGTSNRSKAFHDVCWRNLADAGFPDRILWHRAAAARYPFYDTTRVGLYGHSAGGQNALAGLLFHPEFYTAAYASCGCHDNRMDKIWWNEQWMGWPLGPHYVASSNVENAHRLKGKLFLAVGEMDTNVDPASTMQVVNALIKAKKDFDLLVLPGQGHSMGGQYGERKLYDFFLRNLHVAEPPDWNRLEETGERRQ